MSKQLVVYFSATGTTAKLAETLADVLGADIYPILPQVPYTSADLNWMNPRSRSMVEMHAPASRPAMRDMPCPVEEYDTIFIGFPIWRYVAPTIINTFLERYDLSGKTIVPFATSGGSGMGETNAALQPSCPDSRLLNGKVFRFCPSRDALSAWLATLAL